MHRVFHGLRPAFGIGRDFMGSDGVQKAAALIGGINDRSDDIVDPFLGAEYQPVNPSVRAPLPKSHFHQRVQPQPFAAHLHQQQQPSLRAKEPVQPPSHLGFRLQQQPQTSQQQQHPHTPTPISTLLAFKKQIKTDAATAVDLPLPTLPMCALPQTVLPPTAGPEYPASTFSFLDGDFDLAQELEAIESMKLDSVNNELDAAMDFWGASPEVTMKTESMDMQVFGGLEDMGSIAPQEIFWSEDMSTMPAITIPKDPQPMPIVQQAPPPVAPVVKNTRANPYVHKACVHCKASHVACNNARPCQRCVRSGKADTCVDSERKKRGRPGSSATSSCAADHVDNQATSSSSRPKKRSKPSPPPTLSASVSPTATPAMSTTTEADFAQLFDMPAGNMQGLVPLNLEQSSDLFLDQNLMQQQFNTPEALEAAVVAAAQAMLGGLQQQPQLPENLFAMDDASQQFTFGYTHNLLG